MSVFRYGCSALLICFLLVGLWDQCKPSPIRNLFESIGKISDAEIEDDRQLLSKIRKVTFEDLGTASGAIQVVREKKEFTSAEIIGEFQKALQLNPKTACLCAHLNRLTFECENGTISGSFCNHCLDFTVGGKKHYYHFPSGLHAISLKHFLPTRTSQKGLMGGKFVRAGNGLSSQGLASVATARYLLKRQKF